MKKLKNQGMARSTLIAQYVEQHYEGKSEADIDAEIARLRTESADIVQRVRIEHEKKYSTLSQRMKPNYSRFVLIMGKK